MFDLDAYLARIGLTERPFADADGVALVQRAHRLAIPFENLDVLLGRPIRTDGATVFDKLVTRRRGGYCFEHNRLFLDALAALGFDARPLLARVWLGAEPVPPQTHTLALVRLGEAEWIADTGFGGGYTPPMRLADGEEAIAPDGVRHRLRRDPLHGWMLSRTLAGPSPDYRDGDDQYSFATDRPWPADFALANHWVQTAPESRFVQRPIVSIALPDGYAALDGTRYRRRNGDRVVEGEIADPAVYGMRLRHIFGIDLAAEEVAALGLFG